ncbi:OmpA family protein [Mycobacterium sp.]|uniref:OmpA family protein n=1 Tax=Mycobacterium sp. TaxID=1785 RepID=UPI002BF4DEB5|nr:OmpA family protein [Mycobacterium sp.]HKP43912.1 OmpA family protein [Mycobacterium sp.]
MSGSQPAYPVIESAKNLKRSFSAQRVQRSRMRETHFVDDFDVNSSALLVKHTDLLAGYIEFLREYPDSTVVALVGRASQTGPEANNHQLSRDRAERVRAYLIANGIPEDRVAQAAFHGSEEPRVNVPGREEAMNRSVELVFEWVNMLVDPAYLAGDSMNWKLDLTVTFGVGVGIGGQVQMGRLTNLTTGEFRPVSAWILGIDMGESLIATAATSGGLPFGNDGVFSMPSPPGAVGFDWFDGRFIVLTSVGASAIVGADHSTVRFRNPEGAWPEASFANYPLGLSVGVGGMALIGFFNVDS